MPRMGIAFDDIELIEHIMEGISLIELRIMHRLINIGKVDEPKDYNEP